MFLSNLKDKKGSQSQLKSIYFRLSFLLNLKGIVRISIEINLLSIEFPFNSKGYSTDFN